MGARLGHLSAAQAWAAVCARRADITQQYRGIKVRRGNAAHLESGVHRALYLFQSVRACVCVGAIMQNLGALVFTVELYRHIPSLSFEMDCRRSKASVQIGEWRKGFGFLPSSTLRSLPKFTCFDADRRLRTTILASLYRDARVSLPSNAWVNQYRAFRAPKTRATPSIHRHETLNVY